MLRLFNPKWIFRYDPEPIQLFIGGWILLFGLMMLYNGIFEPRMAADLLAFKVAKNEVPFYYPGIFAVFIGSWLLLTLVGDFYAHERGQHKYLRLAITGNYLSSFFLICTIRAYMAYGTNFVTVYSYVWLLLFSLWLIFRLRYRLTSEGD